MTYEEGRLREPLPGSSGNQESCTLDFGEYSCERVRLLSDKGASGLVYEADSPNFYGEGMQAAHLILKECYPIELSAWMVRDGKALHILEDAPEPVKDTFRAQLGQFKASFNAHASLYQETLRDRVTVPSPPVEANGTVYLVSDASDGEVLDHAYVGMSADTQIRALIKICEVLAALHEDGFAYLDLKPSNVLALRNADKDERDSFTGDVKLFDFGSVLACDRLDAGDAEICGSGDWSAYEQTHPQARALVGKTSDIYAVGAMLFWMLVGRPPMAAEVIHANGEWHFGWENVTSDAFAPLGKAAEPIVNELLNNTLVIDPTYRYASILALKKGLNKLRALAMPCTETMSEFFESAQKRLDERDNRTREIVENLLSDENLSRALINASLSIKAFEGTGEPNEEPDAVKSGAVYPVPEGDALWTKDQLTEVPSFDMLSLVQRNMISCLAFAPEKGFSVDAFLDWCGLRDEREAYKRLCGAGLIVEDVSGSRCRLPLCISREEAFNARADYSSIDHFEDLLWDFAGGWSIGCHKSDGERSVLEILKKVAIDEREYSVVRFALLEAYELTALEDWIGAQLLLARADNAVSELAVEEGWRKGQVLLVAGRLHSLILEDRDGCKNLVEEALGSIGEGDSNGRLWALSDAATACFFTNDLDTAWSYARQCVSEGDYDIRKTPVIDVLPTIGVVRIAGCDLEGLDEVVSKLIAKVEGFSQEECGTEYLKNLMGCALFLDRAGYRDEVKVVHERCAAIACAMSIDDERKEADLYGLGMAFAQAGNLEMLKVVSAQFEKMCLDRNDLSSLSFFYRDCADRVALSNPDAAETMFSHLIEVLEEREESKSEERFFAQMGLISCRTRKRDYKSASFEISKLLDIGTELIDKDQSIQQFYLSYTAFEAHMNLDGNNDNRCAEQLAKRLSVFRSRAGRHDNCILLEGVAGNGLDMAVRKLAINSACDVLTVWRALVRRRQYHSQPDLLDANLQGKLTEEMSWLIDLLFEECQGAELNVLALTTIIECRMTLWADSRDWAEILLQGPELMRIAEESSDTCIAANILQPAEIAMHICDAFSEMGDQGAALQACHWAIRYLERLEQAGNNYCAIAGFFELHKALLRWVFRSNGPRQAPCARQFNTLEENELYFETVVLAAKVDAAFYSYPEKNQRGILLSKHVCFRVLSESAAFASACAENAFRDGNADGA